MLRHACSIHWNLEGREIKAAYVKLRRELDPARSDLGRIVEAYKTLCGAEIGNGIAALANGFIVALWFQYW